MPKKSDKPESRKTTIYVKPDLLLAMKYYLANSTKGRAKSMADIFNQGARLFINRRGTSVEKILRENKGAGR